MRKALLLTVFSIFLLSFIVSAQAQEVIMLDNTSILEDVFVISNDPNTNKNGVPLWTERNSGLTRYRRVYIKWNISTIDGLNIETAEFCSNVTGLFGGGTTHFFEVGAYATTNLTWTENTITWNDQPCGTGITALDGNCTAVMGELNQTMADGEGWAIGGKQTFCWDVRRELITALESGWDNYTIVFHSKYTSGTGEAIAFPDHIADNQEFNLTVVYPAYYNFSVMVRSNIDFHNGTNDECPIIFSNYTIVEFGGWRYNVTDNATLIGYHCEEWGERPYYHYQFINVSAGLGTYILNVSKVGYKDYSQEIDFFATMGRQVTLEAIGTSRVTITVENSTGDRSHGAHVTMWNVEGTQFSWYSSLLGNIINEWWTAFVETPTGEDISGQAIMEAVPIGSYYWVIKRQGYLTETTDSIYITDDYERTITLTETDIEINLACNGTISNVDDLFCSVNLTGFVLPILGYKVNIIHPDLSTTETWYSTDESPTNFTLFSKDWLDIGLNMIYITYNQFTSNSDFVLVTDSAPSQDVESPLIDTGEIDPSLSWLGAILSPISILTMALVGLSFSMEKAMGGAMGDSKGGVFFGCILIGTIILGYSGIYPPLVMLLMIVGNALILGKFVLKLF